MRWRPTKRTNEIAIERREIQVAGGWHGPRRRPLGAELVVHLSIPISLAQPYAVCEGVNFSS